jgi:hypothetical protein
VDIIVGPKNNKPDRIGAFEQCALLWGDGLTLEGENGGEHYEFLL